MCGDQPSCRAALPQEPPRAVTPKRSNATGGHHLQCGGSGRRSRPTAGRRRRRDHGPATKGVDAISHLTFHPIPEHVVMARRLSTTRIYPISLQLGIGGRERAEMMVSMRSKWRPVWPEGPHQGSRLQPKPLSQHSPCICFHIKRKYLLTRLQGQRPVAFDLPATQQHAHSTLCKTHKCGPQLARIGLPAMAQASLGRADAGK